MKGPMNAKKPRKRPVGTGESTVVGVRMLQGSLAELDGWRARHSKPALSRAEAIRRLVEAGLSASPGIPSAGRRNAVRAKQLATREIDILSDTSVSSHAQGQRKRSLTEGPSEFRADRVDFPKVKRK